MVEQSQRRVPVTKQVQRPVPQHPHRVVVVGGGFGGLYAARALRGAPVRVTLIDKKNFHLFQPLLYRVALGGLSPANIAAPLRRVLRRKDNANVRMGQAERVDVESRCVVLADGARVFYDTLILAAGARFHYFGNKDWPSHAPGLKSMEDALGIRGRVYGALEAAEWTKPGPKREAC